MSIIFLPSGECGKLSCMAHLSLSFFSGIFPAEKTVGLERRNSQQSHLFSFSFLLRAVGMTFGFIFFQWFSNYFLNNDCMCGENTGSGNKAVKKRDQGSALITFIISKQEEEQISLIISPDHWTVTLSLQYPQFQSRRPGGDGYPDVPSHNDGALVCRCFLYKSICPDTPKIILSHFYFLSSYANHIENIRAWSDFPTSIHSCRWGSIIKCMKIYIVTQKHKAKYLQ